MRCGQCRGQFTWSSAPLLCPCRGIHYRAALPIVIRCKQFESHVKFQNQHASPEERVAGLSRATRLELKTWNAVQAAVALPLVVPVAVVVAPPLALLQRLREWRAKKLRAARDKKRWPLNDPLVQAALRREGEEERARLTELCRTQGHQFVVDWCSRCGTIDHTYAGKQTQRAPGTAAATSANR